MRIYCAGKFEDSKRVSAIANICENHGHQITARWWQVENQLNPHDIPYYDFARGVGESDIVIVLMDNEETVYFGTLMEIGYALRDGKAVYVIGDVGFKRTPLFQHSLINDLSFLRDKQLAIAITEYINITGVHKHNYRGDKHECLCGEKDTIPCQCCS